MVAVVATVEEIEDGPIRGYDGPQPRIRLTWGEKHKGWGAPWKDIRHPHFLEICEEIS
jgi:hypothetical protein